MNKYQISGVVKEFSGKLQENFGAFIGNKDQQRNGKLMQVLGRAEKKFGDAREIIQLALRHR